MALRSIDLNHTAVLSLDLQSGIVSVYARDDLPARAAALLQNARDAGLTIIQVKVGFRPGVPEINERNNHCADEDYRIFIVKDCCADLDETLHTSLIEKLFPRYATVLSADELRPLLSGSA